MVVFLGSNIKYLRTQLGLSLEKMAQRVDIKGNTISNYENGVTEPKLENLVRISQFFGCSIDDLIQVDLADKGYVPVPKPLPMAQKGDRSHKMGIVTVDTSDNSIVPLLDIKVAAGSPTLLDEPDYYRALPTFSFPRFLFTGQLVGMQVRGESMTPTIKQGDFVIGRYVEDLAELRDGEVHIIIYQESQQVFFTVKRCYYFRGDDTLTLQADNADYPTDKIGIRSLLKLYHVQGCMTTQLYRAEPSVRGHLERIERRIDLLEKKTTV